MADTLTLSDITARIENLTLSTSANFGNWDSTRKTQLANDAYLEVFKLLVELFEENYFFEVSPVLTAVSNTISLEALSPPCYRLRAFQKKVGPDWVDVDLVSPRDAQRRGQSYQETWYRTGDTLRSDRSDTLTGEYRVMYNWRPSKLVNSGDVCLIPVEYAELVPLHGAMDACMQAKANDSYAILLTRWEQRKAEMKKSAANRTASRTRRILDRMGLQGGRDYIFIQSRD